MSLWKNGKEKIERTCAERGKSDMKKCKLLLFDLDGTLLQSDKTISSRTWSVLKKCRSLSAALADTVMSNITLISSKERECFLIELAPYIVTISLDYILYLLMTYGVLLVPFGFAGIQQGKCLLISDTGDW